MRKVLIVYFDSIQKFNGGMQCSKRNRDSIKAIFGSKNCFEYIVTPPSHRKSIKDYLKRMIDICKGFMGGMSSEVQNDLLRIINEQHISDIFFDGSLFGSFARKIKGKYPQINIVTFFHNVEKKYFNDHIKVTRDLIHWYIYPCAVHNEKCAIKYSNKIIALNERDNEELQKLYRRAADVLIPISIKSDSHHQNQIIKNENKKALFIGSYFFANVEGVMWFSKNVLPFVDIDLTIVGASMDKLPQEIHENNKIKIYSDVPDLSPFFQDADFMILPIFSGSGMKVKTAESLMHGKFILGTKEALMGYNLTSECAKECNDSDDFINSINNLELKYKFNLSSYKAFNKYYSFESTLKLFRSVFNY